MFIIFQCDHDIVVMLKESRSFRDNTETFTVKII